MAETTSSASLLREMRPEVAKRHIDSYSSFGQAHLYFAQHAAFPLALTPDLLYRLWANFQQDIHGERLNIPWIAVADLLLSSLCTEVDHELYEMHMAVRTALLSDLKENPRFGERRIEELSAFLLKYVEQQLESHDPDISDFARNQYWTVLAYTSPKDAARELALALHSSLKQGSRAEQIRMALLVETFAEPLIEFAPLLTYARGVGQLARGDVESASTQFRKIEDVVEVEGVKLQLPVQQILKESGGEQRRDWITRKDFFLNYHNTDRAWAEWIGWQLEEAHYSVVLQAWNFQPDANFMEELDKATKIAERIIVIYSRAYLNVLSTMPEWSVAFLQTPNEGRGLLLPIRVDDCDPDALLGPTAFLDLVGLGEPEAREKLLSFVHTESTEAVVPLGFSGEIQRSVLERPEFPGVMPHALSDYRVVWVHGVGPYLPGYSASWTNVLSPYLNIPLGSVFIEVYWRAVFTAMTSAPRQVMSEAALALAAQQGAEVRKALETTLLAHADAQRSDLQGEGSVLAGANEGLLPDWVSNPDAFVGDFMQYLLERDIRTAVKEKMKATLRPLAGQGYDISIIAHSWGTVVAYESLIDLQQELPAFQFTNLFTLGSPLWLVHTLLDDTSGSKPGNVAYWVNIHAQGALIASSLNDFQVDWDAEVPDFSGGVNADNSYFLRGNVAVQRDIVAATILS